ncbi:MAG: carbonic anhydrase [Gammaproteobacteria bacterium]|nr:carbonic anhydrase [Gammaproteobacteria bacterium]
MEQVVAGAVSFREDVFPKHRELFAKLVGGQRPEALFITCSDSRIDPCLVTQTRPGDLFIIRNAGNIVPPHTRHAGGVTASIEYAVSVLDIRHVIVCGHTHCGALHGALMPESIASLTHVREWLEHARAAVEIVRARKGHAGPEHIRDVIEQNVLVQLQHLRTHPVVAAGIAAGRLELHGWVYEIETGDVHCWDESSERFHSLAERYRTLLADETVKAG